MINERTEASPSNIQNGPGDLLAFKGKWKVKGKNFAVAQQGPEMPVKGKVSYQWLAGKFFMRYKWNRKFGERKHIGTAIISWDKDAGFLTRNYDNLGFERAYKITHIGNTWKFEGAKERAVITFSAKGTRFTEFWEVLDNSDWKPLCKLKAKKK